MLGSVAPITTNGLPAFVKDGTDASAGSVSVKPSPSVAVGAAAAQMLAARALSLLVSRRWSVRRPAVTSSCSASAAPRPAGAPSGDWSPCSATTKANSARGASMFRITRHAPRASTSGMRSEQIPSTTAGERRRRSMGKIVEAAGAMPGSRWPPREAKCTTQLSGAQCTCAGRRPALSFHVPSSGARDVRSSRLRARPEVLRV